MIEFKRNKKTGKLEVFKDGKKIGEIETMGDNLTITKKASKRR